MVRFIKSDDGYVNLDQVTRISVREIRGSIFTYKFFTHNNEIIDSRTSGEVPFFDDGEQILAASPNESALILSTEMGDRKPTIDDINIFEVKIVGWRIIDSEAYPIYIGDGWADDAHYIKMPDGKLFSPFNGIVDDLDQAKEEVLNEAVRRWEYIQRANLTGSK